MEKKKKRPCDFEIGDRVAVVDAIELQDIFECYLQQSLSPKDLKTLANRMVTIVWVPNQLELNSWDGCLKIRTDKGAIFKLPFAAIVEIPEEGYVEEPDDEDNDAKPEILIVRDRDSENNLVQQLAAETIQSTFRWISSPFSPAHLWLL
jgi:hypothetical protein